MRNRKKFWSIRKKLVVLFIALAILPGMTIGITSFVDAKTRLQEAKQFEMGTIMQLAKRSIQKDFESLGHMAKVIMHNQEIQTILTASNQPVDAGIIQQDVNQYLASLTESIQYLENITIMNAKGQVVADSDSRRIGIDMGNSHTSSYTLQSGKSQISKAYDSPSSDLKVFAYAEPIFNNEERLIGLALLQIRFFDLFTQSLQDIAIGETGTIMVLDDTGRILLHPEKRKMDTNILRDPEKAVSDFGAQVLRQKEGQLAYNTGSNKRIALVTQILHWQIVFSISSEEVELAAQKLLVAYTAIIGIVLLLALLVAILVSVELARPLKKLSRIFLLMAEGQLQYRLALKRSDELGRMAEALNTTQDKLGTLLGSVLTEAGKLSVLKNELHLAVDTAVGATESISGIIEDVEASTRTQAQCITELTTSVDQMASSINTLDRQLEQQSAELAGCSQSVDILLEGNTAIAQALETNSTSIEQLSGAVSTGQAQLQAVTEDIARILDESAMLDEISKLLQKIANQTKLLAMNATIEAAHAGDAGAGFAVVADEVRILADSASSQAKRVNLVLRKIREGVEQIHAASDSVSVAFTSVIDGVVSVAGQETHIRQKMDSHSHESRALKNAMEKLLLLSREVTDCSSRLQAEKTITTKKSEELQALSCQVQGNMKKIESGRSAIVQTVEQINMVGTATNHSIVRLNEEAAHFELPDQGVQWLA